MRPVRPRPQFGPDGVGDALGRRPGGRGHRLPAYLAFYERIAEEVRAGRRQVTVDGNTLSGEQAAAMADGLSALVAQARYFPEQVREGWEDQSEERLTRRNRRRRLAQVPEVIIDWVSEAYVFGIEMGFAGARIAAEELRPLVEQGEAKDRANVAGGRGKSLAWLAPQWQKVIDREYAEAQGRGRQFKLTVARRKARSEVPKEGEPKRLACLNTIAKWTRDPRDRDRSHMPGI